MVAASDGLPKGLEYPCRKNENCTWYPQYWKIQQTCPPPHLCSYSVTRELCSLGETAVVPCAWMLVYGPRRQRMHAPSTQSSECAFGRSICASLKPRSFWATPPPPKKNMCLCFSTQKQYGIYMKVTVLDCMYVDMLSRA